MKTFLFLLVLVNTQIAIGQTIEFKDCSGENYSVINDRVFHKAETMPSMKDQEEKVKEILTKAVLNSTSGNIEVSFIVFRNGKICLSQIKKDDKLELDTALIKDSVKELQPWKVATQNGYKVSCFVIYQAVVSEGRVEKLKIW